MFVGRNFVGRSVNCACLFCLVKEDVLAPPPENDDVVNDFDIEEEVIEVENRLDVANVIIIFFFFFFRAKFVREENVRVCLRNKCLAACLERRTWLR